MSSCLVFTLSSCQVPFEELTKQSWPVTLKWWQWWPLKIKIVIFIRGEEILILRLKQPCKHPSIHGLESQSHPPETQPISYLVLPLSTWLALACQKTPFTSTNQNFWQTVGPTAACICQLTALFMVPSGPAGKIEKLSHSFHIWKLFVI